MLSSATFRAHLAVFSPTYIFIFTLAVRVVAVGRSANVLVCSLTFAQHSAFSTLFPSLLRFTPRSLSGSDNWPTLPAAVRREIQLKVAHIAHTPRAPHYELMNERAKGILFRLLVRKYLAWPGIDKALALASRRLIAGGGAYSGRAGHR